MGQRRSRRWPRGSCGSKGGVVSPRRAVFLLAHWLARWGLPPFGGLPSHDICPVDSRERVAWSADAAAPSFLPSGAAPLSEVMAHQALFVRRTNSRHLPASRSGPWAPKPPSGGHRRKLPPESAELSVKTVITCCVPSFAADIERISTGAARLRRALC
jgi:hypothetical protein